MSRTSELENGRWNVNEWMKSQEWGAALRRLQSRMEARSESGPLPYPSQRHRAHTTSLAVCCACVCQFNDHSRLGCSAFSCLGISESRPIPKPAIVKSSPSLPSAGCSFHLLPSAHEKIAQTSRFSRSVREPFKSYWASPALQPICSSYSRARIWTVFRIWPGNWDWAHLKSGNWPNDPRFGCLEGIGSHVTLTDFRVPINLPGVLPASARGYWQLNSCVKQWKTGIVKLFLEESLESQKFTQEHFLPEIPNLLFGQFFACPSGVVNLPITNLHTTLAFYLFLTWKASRQVYFGLSPVIITSPPKITRIPHRYPCDLNPSGHNYETQLEIFVSF